MDLDPRTTAVLALHWQHDIVSPAGRFAPTFSAEAARCGVIGRTADLLAAARRAGALVAYTRVCFRAGYPDLVANGPLLAGCAAAGALVDGEQGAAVLDELAPLDGDVVVTHRRISGLYGSDLPTVLQARRIQHVLLTGVATNLTVLNTAFDAVNAGYRTTVVADCCSAAEPSIHDVAVHTIEVIGASTTAAEVVAAFGAAGMSRPRWIPTGTVPDGTVPDGTVPGGTAPGGTVPGGTGPVGTAHPTIDGPASAFLAFERDGWDQVAPVYAELVEAMQLTTGPAGAAILDAAGVGAGQQVLDVACGPGFLAGVAARRGAMPVGLDVSAAMVGEARRRNPALRFEVGAAEAMPLADGAFDAVVSAWGLPHFADHAAVFAEARRVLRPGGTLAMGTWCPPPGNELFAILLGSLGPHVLAPPALPVGPDLFRYADEATATSDLHAAGFTDVACRPITFDAVLPGGGADLVRFLRAGSVRSRAVYAAQPAAARARIDEAVVAAAAELPSSPPGARLRLEAVVISARRPDAAA